MTRQSRILRSNIRLAHQTWGKLPETALTQLEELVGSYRFSVALGHLQFLDGRWYVTHAGLLHLAQCRRCTGIQSRQIREFCDPAACRWVFKATVYKSRGSKGFAGFGDADPSNVSPLVRGAEMRVAETRAVNRALRKAYGIGLCSVEEIGSFPSPFELAGKRQNAPRSAGGNGSGNGQPRLRDRLCLLIRQHKLDPTLVKRYAADFCGTEALRDTSRELVESFINHLAEWAAKDREGLLCKLNGYSQTKEVKS